MKAEQQSGRTAEQPRSKEVERQRSRASKKQGGRTAKQPRSKEAEQLCFH